jgi:hypothetical protein
MRQAHVVARMVGEHDARQERRRRSAVLQSGVPRAFGGDRRGERAVTEPFVVGLGGGH